MAAHGHHCSFEVEHARHCCTASQERTRQGVSFWWVSEIWAESCACHCLPLPALSDTTCVCGVGGPSGVVVACLSGFLSKTEAGNTSRGFGLVSTQGLEAAPHNTKAYTQDRPPKLHWLYLYIGTGVSVSTRAHLSCWIAGAVPAVNGVVVRHGVQLVVRRPGYGRHHLLVHPRAALELQLHGPGSVV